MRRFAMKSKQECTQSVEGHRKLQQTTRNHNHPPTQNTTLLSWTFNDREELENAQLNHINLWHTFGFKSRDWKIWDRCWQTEKRLESDKPQATLLTALQATGSNKMLQIFLWFFVCGLDWAKRRSVIYLFKDLCFMIKVSNRLIYCGNKVGNWRLGCGFAWLVGGTKLCVANESPIAREQALCYTCHLQSKTKRPPRSVFIMSILHLSREYHLDSVSPLLRM